jgi:hypothetical protein
LRGYGDAGAPDEHPDSDADEHPDSDAYEHPDGDADEHAGATDEHADEHSY